MSTAGARVNRVVGINGQRLVGVREVADYLGVTVGFVYKHKARIPHIKIGKYLRFDLERVRSDLEQASAIGE